MTDQERIRRLRLTLYRISAESSDRSARALAKYRLSIDAWFEENSDSDGTASAALCEDIAVPKDCQARPSPNPYAVKGTE